MTDTSPSWLQERERGNLLLLWLMHRLARNTPGFVADPLIWLISFYYTLFPSKQSAQGARRYMRSLLGRQPSFADRHRQVRTFGHVVFDRVRLLESGASAFVLRPHNHEVVVRRHAARSGGVLLGAHFGSFEALRAFDRLLPGLTVRYLMFTENAEKTTKLLSRMNPEVASRVIPLIDGAKAMLEVREALEQGQFVAFLGDRMPSTNRRAELTVQFLGGNISIPRAPYLCAMLARVPIILCFAPMVGKRTYDVFFSEIYEGAPVARVAREAKCAELAQRYANELASMCRRYPYNWFNFFDIWR